jgi:GNAT superfamily N-acetyltransferase
LRCLRISDEFTFDDHPSFAPAFEQRKGNVSVSGKSANNFDSQDSIRLRPMTAADVGHVPIVHQGDRDEVLERIADLGSSAILAFDGDRHVGQLQFRRYRPGVRSPQGLWDPLYWGDFEGYAPELPDDTLAVFCYHVGQVDDTEARDPRYQGRGLGTKLLDYFLDWIMRAGFEGVIAKAVPDLRPIMAFMGGQPARVYQARGFEIADSWIDPEVRAVVNERSLAPNSGHPNDAARVACCVRRMLPTR